MIKNIMKNIGTEKAGMPEKIKQAYIDHAKKIGVDSLESLIRNKDKAYVDYNDEIAQIYADELKTRKPAKETEKDAGDTLSLEEVIKAKNDRIAELSKAHPNEWAMNGRNTDFDKIVENDPVIKKLDSFKF